MKFIASSICQGMRTDTVYHFLNLNFADKYTNSTILISSMEEGRKASGSCTIRPAA